MLPRRGKEGTAAASTTPLLTTICESDQHQQVNMACAATCVWPRVMRASRRAARASRRRTTMNPSLRRPSLLSAASSLPPCLRCVRKHGGRRRKSKTGGAVEPPGRAEDSTFPLRTAARARLHACSACSLPACGRVSTLQPCACCCVCCDTPQRRQQGSANGGSRWRLTTPGAHAARLRADILLGADHEVGHHRGKR